MLRLQRGGITAGDDIGWDPQAGLIDAPAFEGIDAVVHLAGEGIGDKRWTEAQKDRILQSRVKGTSVLSGAIASREQKPRVFVSGSAIGYYGSAVTKSSPKTVRRATTSSRRSCSDGKRRRDPQSTPASAP